MLKVLTFSLFGLVILFCEQSSSTLCANYLKNCIGISAEKKYLGSRPVCLMEARCDRYCEMKVISRPTVQLFCGMTAKGECLPAEDCLEDQSVLKEDLPFLTDQPTTERRERSRRVPPRTRGAR